ncbi:MAG: glycosyltransferase family 4 protein [Desulfuromonadales bacterium]|nr:glycosyltransferase family 4 protein [Desulfuromonadales bacterium]
MRIAFLTPEYITETNFDGGLANHLGRVCPGLVAMGHEVAVFVVSEKEGRTVHEGVEVYRVNVNNTLLIWLKRLALRRLTLSVDWIVKSWAMNRVCARVHREQPFDLVQYASHTATGLLRNPKIPSVVRLSSYEPLLRSAYNLPSTLDRVASGWLEKTAMFRCDAVFSPSQFIAEIVTKKTGKAVEVIEPPFMVNSQKWDDSVYRGSLAGKRYLLFYGTLGRLKGVATIAEIIRPLLTQNPELYFVFIGKDFGFSGRSMMEQVWEKADDCRARVLYRGKMQHAQLYPILSNAHAVVLPSLVDNLPNTCLEAMAFKRVVIGTRGVSFEQLIDDGVSGFLCEPDNPQDLLRVTNQVLSLTDAVAADVGENAARRIKKLSPEKALGRLVSYYQSVCDAFTRRNV